MGLTAPSEYVTNGSLFSFRIARSAFGFPAPLLPPPEGGGITPLRGVIPPLRGGNKGAGKPKADRATTKKENKLPFRYAVFGWGC